MLQNISQGLGFFDTTCVMEWENNSKLVVKEFGWGEWTRFFWRKMGAGGGSCECGNKLSGSINAGNFLTS
jgi:hypothetical protein